MIMINMACSGDSRDCRIMAAFVTHESTMDVIVVDSDQGWLMARRAALT